MKAELERIWKEEPLAWPMNVAGWSLNRPTTKVIRAGMTSLIGWHRIKIIGKFFSLKGKRNRIKNVSTRKTSYKSKRIASSRAR